MIVVKCLCPSSGAGEARHPSGDTITLREKLDFRAAVTMQKTVSVFVADEPDAAAAQILGVLTESYLRYGIESWTLVGVDGLPIPVSQETIEQYLLNGDLEAAMLVADAADDLYAKAVLLPLVERGSRSSPDSPMTESTSAETSPSVEPPTPSRPSLISTFPTVSTGETFSEPDGDSSSSPSLASVG